MAWFKKNKSTELAVFTGFKSVRSINGPSGGEKFGLIELAPEYAVDIFTSATTDRKHRLATSPTRPVYTAALRLTGPGLNRWLSEGKDDETFFARLCQGLPSDSPSQFLLRRRRGQLGQHYNFTRQQALQKLKDEEIAGFFLQDYLDNQIYPVEDNGLAEIWCGVLITGRSEEEITGRLAHLLANLPCDATPCRASELTELLLDHYGPLLVDQQPNGQPEETADGLYAEWLAEVPFEIVEDTVYNGLANAFWTLSAPPLKNETGWTRRLLENEVLTGSEFDITVHLAPAYQEATMQEVLARRLALLDEQIELALDSYHRAEADELREQYSEIQARLYGLTDEQHRYFEIGITLGLRALAEELEEECEVFEEELRSCGLAAHRTASVSQTQSAMLDCAPLNLSRFDRPFVLPAPQAGRLAHLGTVSQPESGPQNTLVGLSPAGEPVYLEAAARAGQSAFFLVGEPGQSTATRANELVRYMAGLRWFKGGPVYGLDRQGDWQWLVERLGGHYVTIGETSNGYNFNPLEVTGETLGQIGQLAGWVKEIGYFLSAILALPDGMPEDLSAVLLEAALDRVHRGQEISAAALWIRAETSGYLELAGQLRQLGANGRYGWMCAQPTRLPQPGQEDLLFVGLAQSMRESWSETAQTYYFGRLFARFAAYAGNQPPARPYLLLIDQAHRLLADPVAARSLGWLGQNAANFKLNLWLVAPRADEWLGSYSGRGLLEKAQTVLFFNQTGPGLAGSGRRLKLSQRFMKAVREALPGAALVRQLDEDGEPTLFAFEPLPGGFVAQLAARTAQVNPRSTTATPRPKPIEVPLFAPEEIWGNELRPDEVAEPVEIEAEFVWQDDPLEIPLKQLARYAVG